MANSSPATQITSGLAWNIFAIGNLIRHWLTLSAGSEAVPPPPGSAGDGFQILYEPHKSALTPPRVIFVHSRTFAVTAAVPGLVGRCQANTDWLPG